MYKDLEKEDRNLSDRFKNFFVEIKRVHPLILLSFLFIFICLILIIINVFFTTNIDPEAPDVVENNDIVSRLESMKKIPDSQDTEFLADEDIDTYNEYYIEFGTIYPPGVQLYKIGDEVITTDYYNYYLITEHPDTLQNPSQVDREFVELMDNVIKQESVILQTFAKDDPKLENHILDLDLITYNHLRERDKAFKEAAEKYITANLRIMKGERISIWYHNMFEPKMGLQAAKSLAYEKITSLHQRVSSGEINMREAADIIRNDNEIAKIDLAYQSNAYYYFEKRNNIPVYLDPDIEYELVNMKEGEISEVLNGNDIDGGYDAYYTFIKINEVSGEVSSIYEIYDNNKMNYPITAL